MRFEQCKKEDIDMLLMMKMDNILAGDINHEIVGTQEEKIKGYVLSDLKKEYSFFSKIINDDVVVGVYGLCPFKDGYLIDELYVYEDYRGFGYGSFVLDYIRKNNIANIYLWVYKSNVGAIRLYNRFGYKIVEETELRYLMIDEH